MNVSQHSNICFCSINNDGVTLLRNRKFQEASVVFVNAIKELRRAIAVSSFDSSESPYCCPRCCFTKSRQGLHHSVTREDSDSTVEVCPEGHATRLSTFQQSSFSPSKTCPPARGTDEHGFESIALTDFLFSCPTTALPGITCDQLKLDRLCIILTYNLALSLDLLACSPGGEEWNYPSKSLKLYTLAFDLQNRASLKINVLHSCGMLNNMSRLYLRVGDRDSSIDCRRQLLSALVMFTERKNQPHRGMLSAEENEKQKEYLDKFWKSALSIFLTDPATAHAA